MKKIPPYEPTNDLIFKFVFGREERKRVTLTCINDLLGRTGEDAFVDLDFQNVEMIPATEDEKQGRLDVFAVLDNNTRVQYPALFIFAAAGALLALRALQSRNAAQADG